VIYVAGKQRLEEQKWRSWLTQHSEVYYWKLRVRKYLTEQSIITIHLKQQPEKKKSDITWYEFKQYNVSKKNQDSMIF